MAGMAFPGAAEGGGDVQLRLLKEGFTSWIAPWAKAVMVELALEYFESIADHVGIWGAMVCRWAREISAEPRFLSLALA
jgi:hypothetical protein